MYLAHSVLYYPATRRVAHWVRGGGRGGGGGGGPAGDVDGGSSTGAAGCSKRCAASLGCCVVPLLLKENQNFYQIQITVHVQ
jgi:hypothetical protein